MKHTAFITCFFLVTCCCLTSIYGQFSTTNLRLWLKADELISSVSDGSRISQWNDLSGNSYHALQSAASSQPVFRVSAVNGMPGLYFDGSTSSMVLPSPQSMGLNEHEIEVFIVTQYSSRGYQILFTSHGVSYNCYEMSIDRFTAGASFISSPSAPCIDAGSSGSYADNMPHIFSGRANSTSGVIRVDKSDISSKGGSGITSENCEPMTIGCNYEGNNKFNGYIAEIIIFNSCLSNEDRDAVEEYLWDKYYSLGFVVNSTDDSNTGTGRYGTLRYAINGINNAKSSSSTTINMTGISGTITLTSDLPPLNYNTKILGPGESNLTISGGDSYRPFFIGAGTSPFSAENPAKPVVTISNLTIAHGKAKGGDAGPLGGGAAGMGGAIFLNDGNLTLDHIFFSDNSAVGGSTTSGRDMLGGGGGFAGNGNFDSPLEPADANGGSSGYLGGSGGQGSYTSNDGTSGGPGKGGGGGVYTGGDGGFGAGGGGAFATKGGGGGFGGGAGYPGGIPGFCGGSANSDNGGGGAALGGALFNRNGALIISNSTFVRNSTTGGFGGTNGLTCGGAIFNYGGSISYSNITYGTGANGNSAFNEPNLYLYGGDNLVPVMSSLKATSITAGSANLTAVVNSKGNTVNYRFDYGTDPDNLLNSSSISSDNSSSPVTISASISGLTSGSFYYFKLTATYNSTELSSTLSAFEYNSDIPHSNLKLWLSADKGVASSSSYVDVWYDRTGSGSKAVQSSYSARPQYQTGTLNGKAVIHFDGAGGQYIVLPDASALGMQNSDYEIFIVARSSSSACQLLMGGTIHEYELMLNNSSYGLQYVANGTEVGPSKEFYHGSSGTYTDNRPHLFNISVASTGGKLFVDGTLAASTVSDFTNSDGAMIWLGKRTNDSMPFTGDIAEVIIYNTTLDQSARNTIQTYLAGKYNITSGALPVELTTFTAVVEKKNTILKWKTATEVNNYGFEIERSLVTGHQSLAKWEKIGFVQGNGNSNSPKMYEFTDKQPMSGKNFYRLKQIDNDGNYEYSHEVEVNIKDAPDNFEFFNNYPNPANPVTTIKFGIPVRSSVSINIYNTLGELVTQLTNEVKDPGYYEVRWDASNVSSGIYFYIIRAKEDGRAKEYKSVKKMIILK